MSSEGLLSAFATSPNSVVTQRLPFWKPSCCGSWLLSQLLPRISSGVGDADAEADADAGAEALSLGSADELSLGSADELSLGSADELGSVVDTGSEALGFVDGRLQLPAQRRRVSGEIDTWPSLMCWVAPWASTYQPALAREVFAWAS